MMTVEEIAIMIIDNATRREDDFTVYEFPYSIPLNKVRSFSITEWNGTTNNVDVIWGENSNLLIKYEDGVIHEVTPAYFFNELKPTPIKPTAVKPVMPVMPIVVKAEIVQGRYENTIMVELDNGSIEDVFSYYNDELYFRAHQFIGLTIKQVHNLFFETDKAYLQS